MIRHHVYDMRLVRLWGGDPDLRHERRVARTVHAAVTQIEAELEAQRRLTGEQWVVASIKLAQPSGDEQWVTLTDDGPLSPTWWDRFKERVCRLLFGA